MFNRLSLWLLSVCCLALVTTEAFAQKGGGGTTPPPPLPNVRYQVVEFRKLLSPEDVWVNQINNAGMIVGRFANSAFIYDQPRGLLYKLNEEQSLPLKLDAEFGINWIFESAIGINDLGQVVGRVRNLGTQQTEGFAMNTFSNPDSSTWQVKRLPPVPGNNSYARRINFSGQVLGSYVPVGSTDSDCFVCYPWDTGSTAIPFNLAVNRERIGINNHGIVAGKLTSGLTFYGTSSSIKTVNEIGSGHFGGINDLGIMSVSGRAKINNKLHLSATYRVSTSTVSYSLEKVLEGGHPWGMNQESDIAIKIGTQSKLAYNGSTALGIPKQVLSITDLILEGPMKNTLVNNDFFVTAIGDRNYTGFGQLAGNVRTATEFIGVVLTPYVPVP